MRAPPKALPERALIQGGIQSAGTRSRATSSGEDARVDLVGLARPRGDRRTLRGSAIWTSQPVAYRRSLTHTAPLIISTHALTSVPSSSDEPRQPVLVSREPPSRVIWPPSPRRAPRGPAIRPIDSDILRHGTSSCPDCVPSAHCPGRPGALLHDIQSAAQASSGTGSPRA